MSLSRLIYIKSDCDESDEKQIVFHFDDDNKLYTTYSEIMIDHKENLLSHLVKDISEKYSTDENNIIHVRWIERHTDVSIDNIKCFIQRNRCYKKRYTIYNYYGGSD